MTKNRCMACVFPRQILPDTSCRQRPTMSAKWQAVFQIKNELCQIDTLVARMAEQPDDTRISPRILTASGYRDVAH